MDGINDDVIWSEANLEMLNWVIQVSEAEQALLSVAVAPGSDIPTTALLDSSWAPPPTAPYLSPVQPTQDGDLTPHDVSLCWDEILETFDRYNSNWGIEAPGANPTLNALPMSAFTYSTPESYLTTRGWPSLGESSTSPDPHPAHIQQAPFLFGNSVPSTTFTFSAARLTSASEPLASSTSSFTTHELSSSTAVATPSAPTITASSSWATPVSTNTIVSTELARAAPRDSMPLPAATSSLTSDSPSDTHRMPIAMLVEHSATSDKYKGKQKATEVEEERSIEQAQAKGQAKDMETGMVPPRTLTAPTPSTAGQDPMTVLERMMKSLTIDSDLPFSSEPLIPAPIASSSSLCSATKDMATSPSATAFAPSSTPTAFSAGQPTMLATWPSFATAEVKPKAKAAVTKPVPVETTPVGTGRATRSRHAPVPAPKPATAATTPASDVSNNKGRTRESEKGAEVMDRSAQVKGKGKGKGKGREVVQAEVKAKSSPRESSAPPTAASLSSSSGKIRSTETHVETAVASAKSKGKQKATETKQGEEESAPAMGHPSSPSSTSALESSPSTTAAAYMSMRAATHSAPAPAATEATASYSLAAAGSSKMKPTYPMKPEAVSLKAPPAVRISSSSPNLSSATAASATAAASSSTPKALSSGPQTAPDTHPSSPTAVVMRKAKTITKPAATTPMPLATASAMRSRSPATLASAPAPATAAIATASAVRKEKWRAGETERREKAKEGSVQVNGKGKEREAIQAEVDEKVEEKGMVVMVKGPESTDPASTRTPLQAAPRKIASNPNTSMHAVDEGAREDGEIDEVDNLSPPPLPTDPSWFLAYEEDTPINEPCFVGDVEREMVAVEVVACGNAHQEAERSTDGVQTWVAQWLQGPLQWTTLYGTDRRQWCNPTRSHPSTLTPIEVWTREVFAVEKRAQGEQHSVLSQKQKQQQQAEAQSAYPQPRETLLPAQVPEPSLASSFPQDVPMMDIYTDMETHMDMDKEMESDAPQRTLAPEPAVVAKLQELLTAQQRRQEQQILEERERVKELEAQLQAQDRTHEQHIQEFQQAAQLRASEQARAQQRAYEELLIVQQMEYESVLAQVQAQEQTNQHQLWEQAQALTYTVHQQCAMYQAQQEQQLSEQIERERVWRLQLQQEEQNRMNDQQEREAQLRRLHDEIHAHQEARQEEAARRQRQLKDAAVQTEREQIPTPLPIPVHEQYSPRDWACIHRHASREARIRSRPLGSERPNAADPYRRDRKARDARLRMRNRNLGAKIGFGLPIRISDELQSRRALLVAAAVNAELSQRPQDKSMPSPLTPRDDAVEVCAMKNVNADVRHVSCSDPVVTREISPSPHTAPPSTPQTRRHVHWSEPIVTRRFSPPAPSPATSRLAAIHNPVIKTGQPSLSQSSEPVDKKRLVLFVSLCISAVALGCWSGDVVRGFR